MNPYLLGLIDVFAATVAVMSTLVVLAGFAAKKRFFARPAVAAVLAWAVFAWAESKKEPGYDREEIARVDRELAPLRPRLEEYRVSHGSYPTTLEEVGITPPATRYGPVIYHPTVASGGPAYELVVGDYVRNGFTSTWRSNTGEWGLRSDD